MVQSMCEPKLIENITINDLKANRWCLYHNDDEGYDCFEHIIPDTHPDFSHHVIEFELAEFKFNNGKVAFGYYNGTNFNILLDGELLMFWFGIAKPSDKDSEKIRQILLKNEFELPVEAKAIWSNETKVFKGLQDIENGNIVEITI